VLSRYQPSSNLIDFFSFCPFSVYAGSRMWVPFYARPYCTFCSTLASANARSQWLFPFPRPLEFSSRLATTRRYRNPPSWAGCPTRSPFFFLRMDPLFPEDNVPRCGQWVLFPNVQNGNTVYSRPVEGPTCVVFFFPVHLLSGCRSLSFSFLCGEA